MPPRAPASRIVRGAVTLIADMLYGSISTTQAPRPPAPTVQTLCVLDFQRLGDDARRTGWSRAWPTS